MGAVAYCHCAGQQDSSGYSLKRRGGCASNRKLRSHRSGADGVVSSARNFSLGLRPVGLALRDRPVRSFQRWLRSIFLMSRPPLLFKERKRAHRKVVEKLSCLTSTGKEAYTG